jgi:hypothetical protein
VQRLRRELWLRMIWLLHHDKAQSHTSFITRIFLTKRTRLSSPIHPIFLYFP